MSYFRVPVEKQFETTKWLNMNNHGCIPWDMITSRYMQFLGYGNE